VYDDSGVAVSIEASFVTGRDFSRAAKRSQKEAGL
jgi:hypothetical protein